MPTAAKSKRRVARGCAVGGAELRLKGLKKSDRRHGGASLVRCRKFRPVAGGLYRSLTGYVVKIKTDAGKVRYVGPRGLARLQSRAKRFDTQSEAKQAAESTIARGYGKIRSAAVVKVVAGTKKASSRKSVKNGLRTVRRKSAGDKVALARDGYVLSVHATRDLAYDRYVKEQRKHPMNVFSIVSVSADARKGDRVRF